MANVDKFAKSISTTRQLVVYVIISPVWWITRSISVSVRNVWRYPECWLSRCFQLEDFQYRGAICDSQLHWSKLVYIKHFAKFTQLSRDYILVKPSSLRGWSWFAKMCFAVGSLEDLITLPFRHRSTFFTARHSQLLRFLLPLTECMKSRSLASLIRCLDIL